jgi:hypothetical protein
MTVEPAAHSARRTVNGKYMPEPCRPGGVRAAGSPFQVADMSGQIIRLSIPIATIAVSSAAVFGLSWIGLALLGF